MTDIKTIATGYIDLWNERAADRRREMLTQNWTGDARYVDPLMSGDGRDGIEALIAGVQQRFPEFKFKLLGEPNGYGDNMRFCWGTRPRRRRQPDQGHRFRRAERRPHPQHHGISRPVAASGVTRRVRQTATKN
jgi:hypothetical protein